MTIEDFTGRVTLILANNFATKCILTMALQVCNTIFLHPFIFFNPNPMLINANTKEFTLTNNAFLSYVIAFEHLLYYKMVANDY